MFHDIIPVLCQMTRVIKTKLLNLKKINRYDKLITKILIEFYFVSRNIKSNYKYPIIQGLVIFQK